MEIAEEDLGLQFELRWRPYFLNPNIKQAIPKRVAYGKRMEANQVVKMERNMKRLFDGEGIGYTLDGDMNATLNSHKLMELAFEQGGPELQDKMAEVFFRCYFTDAKDVGSREVLLAAAAEVGLTGAEACLDDSSMAERVLADIDVSRQSHPMLTGVPHYVIMAVDENTDEVKAGFEVPGAQDTMTFVNVLRKLKSKVWDQNGELLPNTEPEARSKL